MFTHLVEAQARGEIPTGLLYLDEDRPDMHGVAASVDRPLVDVPHEALCPGADALEALQSRWR